MISCPVSCYSQRSLPNKVPASHGEILNARDSHHQCHISRQKSIRHPLTVFCPLNNTSSLRFQYRTRVLGIDYFTSKNSVEKLKKGGWLLSISRCIAQPWLHRHTTGPIAYFRTLTSPERASPIRFPIRNHAHKNEGYSAGSTGIFNPPSSQAIHHHMQAPNSLPVHHSGNLHRCSPHAQLITISQNHWRPESANMHKAISCCMYV